MSSYRKIRAERPGDGKRPGAPVGAAGPELELGTAGRRARRSIGTGLNQAPATSVRASSTQPSRAMRPLSLRSASTLATSDSVMAANCQ